MDWKMWKCDNAGKFPKTGQQQNERENSEIWQHWKRNVYNGNMENRKAKAEQKKRNII